MYYPSPDELGILGRWLKYDLDEELSRYKFFSRTVDTSDRMNSRCSVCGSILPMGSTTLWVGRKPVIKFDFRLEHFLSEHSWPEVLAGLERKRFRKVTARLWSFFESWLYLKQEADRLQRRFVRIVEEHLGEDMEMRVEGERWIPM